MHHFQRRLEQPAVTAEGFEGALFCVHFYRRVFHWPARKVIETPGVPIVIAHSVCVTAPGRLRLGEVLFGDAAPRQRPLVPAQAVDPRQRGAGILGPDAAERRHVAVGTPLHFLLEFVQTARTAGDQFVHCSANSDGMHGDSSSPRSRHEGGMRALSELDA